MPSRSAHGRSRLRFFARRLANIRAPALSLRWATPRPSVPGSRALAVREPLAIRRIGAQQSGTGGRPGRRRRAECAGLEVREVCNAGALGIAAGTLDGARVA